MKNKFLTIFILLPILSIAQSNLLKPQNDLIGTIVDTIEVSHYLLNETNDKNFNLSFKVLEFWATWCKPCLKAVPHLNKMQSKFKHKNIVFLSITYEAPEKTIKTLERVKFETIVVSDTTKAIHKKLRIEFNGTMPLPRTVLIDDENKIIWYGSPKDLNPNLIEKFLSKQSLNKK